MRAGGLGFLAMSALSGCGDPESVDFVGKLTESAQQQAVKGATTAGFKDLPDRIYIRVFKQERELEIWGSEKDGKSMVLVAKYPVAKMSGGPGPKRRQGDRQVPEGLYVIDRFNPKSQFHLSLGLNYPNASDLIRSDKEHPGGDIFIHGSNVSIGCMAMTDPIIEEIWVFATHARYAGQRDIPVHVFPARMDGVSFKTLRRENVENQLLWDELKPFFDAFEQDRVVPDFLVSSDGAYVIQARPS